MAKAWEKFEQHVAQLFGLTTTISSGNKWFDQGDAVTRGHHPWPLYADAKHTSKNSFSLKLKDLSEMEMQAFALGKHFILPLRFFNVERQKFRDYVVLPLDDFKELYDKAVG